MPIKKLEGQTADADRAFSLSSVTSPLGAAPWPTSLRSPEQLADTVVAAAHAAAARGRKAEQAAPPRGKGRPGAAGGGSGR